MPLSALTAISPIDGRYHTKTKVLAPFFSEYGLIKYRIQIEIAYFIALCELPLPQLADFDKTKFDLLRSIYQNFATADAEKIKEIEKTTNHDVKAVEYFIKQQFDNLGLSEYKEFIHFGLTSQDINNTAIPLSLKEGIAGIIRPQFSALFDKFQQMGEAWAAIPMLSRTHGQPASPTKLGKEIFVFAERLQEQLFILDNMKYAAKFGGATGNFNAHHIAYPDIDWVAFANRFVNTTLQLNRNQYSTQIEHYDHLAALCDCLKRINTILIDFSRDMWQYISMEYFKQKTIKGEIGSSAMPHKVNPIDFENAEGNFGIANALLEHLAAKLPISRLQRDLTDSTVLRNIGVPLAHILISLQSLQKGIEKLQLNEAAINEDLDNNWAVVAEAIQTVLRKENYPNPYEALKELTRGNQITKDSMHTFIDSLNVSADLKMQLKSITPFNYTGVY